jgi:hypothetical protein
MKFYADSRIRDSNLTIRVHPLLLSLTETISASETNPDISTISENDKRALRSNFYTSPNTLPPLEIHFSGQNGPSLLSNKNGCALTPESVAGCRECMGSAPQDDSGRESNAAQGISAATFHALEGNLAHVGSTSPSARNKGKKRRCASSGGVQGNISNTRGPKAAGVIHRAKGKQAETAGSCDANPSPLEEKSDKSTKEGRDQEAGPRMFIGVPIQSFPNDYDVR